MNRAVKIVLGLIFVLSSVTLCRAADDQTVLDAVKKHLQERMKSSGTLDIYDPQNEKVRNLRTLKFPETVSKEGDGYVAEIQMGDANDGTKVLVHVTVEEKGGQPQVKDVKVSDAKGPAAAPVDPKREITDAEIQQVMNDYISQQTQVSSSLPLFDAERNKLRKLELIVLDKEVRRLGIYYISHAQFKDTESGELLDVDVTVENQKGELALQSLRIRKVTRPKVSDNGQPATTN